MDARRTQDLRPGSLPEIRSDGTSVVFQFEIGGLPRASRLIIRCDADGSVWASTTAIDGRDKTTDPR
jgi:hypothetical protein